MFSLLALASAAFYGAADFVGGFTSRRANAIAVVVVSQLAGMVLLVLMLPFLPSATVERSDYVWGALAGLMGGIGVFTLYQALAVGTMSVVAPITAVCAVAIPVIISVALGERPAVRSSAGIVLAIVAIVLVSQQHEPAGGSKVVFRMSGIGLALASGVAIGLFFFALARSQRDAGLWPLLFARLVSVPLFAIVALVRRTSVRMPPRVAALTALGGSMDMFANLLYLLATRRGPLSVAVTLSSLYPASTVILARIVLAERLSARQTAGIICALVAVVLIVS